MDGGAMTGTTNRLDLLWHIQWAPAGRYQATLKVADYMPHYPKAIDYLRVTMDAIIGYRRLCQ
jgi:hypothetical protein